MFDGLQGRHLLAVHKREGVADILSPSCAADAVHIIFRMLGDIVIDNVTHTGDVESARCDIGRHHDFVFAALESLQRFDPFTLGAIGMQHRHRMLRVLEGVRYAISVLFRPAKNQYAVEICSL
jgi:hypothetical protein